MPRRNRSAHAGSSAANDGSLESSPDCLAGSGHTAEQSGLGDGQQSVSRTKLMALTALDGKTYHFMVPLTAMDQEALI